MEFPGTFPETAHVGHPLLSQLNQAAEPGRALNRPVCGPSGDAGGVWGWASPREGLCPGLEAGSRVRSLTLSSKLPGDHRGPWAGRDPCLPREVLTWPLGARGDPGHRRPDAQRVLLGDEIQLLG